ncbi:MFS transporter [Lentzea tibetensis]|uniref:MFS transporter n=1 Tax=Lentzea tibetensis TaxID=2591470 RepID=A0A563ENH1_9PSEU|nr:MFS transporter [Lentzea tibetensis]TWP48181.1 MFS transporter [Lentzea tibetensis]
MRSVLSVLCLTQVTGWGIVFFAFALLSKDISADTGWSSTWVVAGFSLAQIVSAAVGIPVGRVLDRYGPRVVMTAGSVLASVSIVLLTTAHDLTWYFAAWTLIGVSMAGVLYQPAFAALTHWSGENRITALTTLTLVGGLASTVFAPLTAWLVEDLGWRQTYLVLAVVLAVVTVPAHFFGLRRPWTPQEHSHEHAPRTIARSRPFVLLVVSVSMAGFAIYAVVIALVPLLSERGLSTTTAAWALGLGGVGQVFGRLGYGWLSARTGVRGRTVGVMLAAAVTIVVLGLVPGPALALVAASILAGAVRGVFTLLHATAISDRWGPAGYGQLNGLMTAPLTVSAAVSPWVAAWLVAPIGGYPPVFLVLAAVALVAGALAAQTGQKATAERVFTVKAP